MSSTLMSAKIKFVFLSLLSCGVAQAENCSPLPPKCQRVSDRAMQMMQQVQGGNFAGITDAASQLYCLSLIAIEVNNLCAAEYDSLGKRQCASLSRQQSEAYRPTKASAEATANAVSIRNARNRCTFE